MADYVAEGRVRLSVLRASGLSAADFYGPLKEASSDPYGIVMVDGVEVGRTPARSSTLDPVWAGEASFVFECKHTSRVRVVLRDWDVTKEDDPLGEVSFVVGDVEKERRGKAQYNPNKWFNVVPTGDSPSHGRVELGILFDEECPQPEGCTQEFASLSSRKWESQAAIYKAIKEAACPVLLHIYDVGHSSTIKHLNNATELAVGGIFHGALQVYAREYSFGGTKNSQSGIFACMPTKCPMHTYRETVYLGDCYLPKNCVKAILSSLVPSFNGTSYDLLRKNCCHFCDELAIELGVGPTPAWTSRLANVGAMLEDTISGATKVDTLQHLIMEEQDFCLSSLLVDHIMAVKLQRAYRRRQAAKRVILFERHKSDDDQ